MYNRNEQLYFRLSLLMFAMSLLSMFAIIVVLFILTALDAFDCTSTDLCILHQNFDHYYYILGVFTGIFVLFLVMAKFLQRFFSIDDEVASKLMKPKKTKKDHVFKRKDTKFYESPAQSGSLNSFQGDSKQTIARPEILVRQPTKPKPGGLEEVAIKEKPIFQKPIEPSLQPKPDVLKQEVSPVEELILPTPIEQPLQPKSDVFNQKVSHPEVQITEKTVLPMEVIKHAEGYTLEETPKSQVDMPLISSVKRRTLSHTKEDISLIIERKTTLSREEARHFLDTLCEIISSELINHQKVSIHQFGTFFTSKLQARDMVVHTREEQMTSIPERYVVRFKQSDLLEDYINNPHLYLGD